VKSRLQLIKDDVRGCRENGIYIIFNPEKSIDGYTGIGVYFAKSRKNGMCLAE